MLESPHTYLIMSSKPYAGWFKCSLNWLIDPAGEKNPQTLAGAWLLLLISSEIEVVAKLVEGRNSDRFSPSIAGDCLPFISLFLLTFGLFMYPVSIRSPSDVFFMFRNVRVMVRLWRFLFCCLQSYWRSQNFGIALSACSWLWSQCLLIRFSAFQWPSQCLTTPFFWPIVLVVSGK